MSLDSVTPEAKQRFYENANKAPPSIGGSMFNSFKGSALAGVAAVSALGEAGSAWVDNAYRQVQIENQREDELTTTAQMGARKTLSAIPSILGMVLDPVSAATGYVGGAAVGAAVHTVVPKIAERELARKILIQEMGGKVGREAVPVTVGELAARGAHGAGVGAGYSVPGAMHENLDEETKTIHWGGVAKEAFANGAMGFALPIVGYGMGVLWRSYFPKEGKTPIPGTPEVPNQLAMINQAYEAGHIPKQEFELMRDYLTDPTDPSIKKRFNEQMLKRGHEINSATYEAYFKMLSDEDMQNLKSIMATELNNHELMTDKDALSQFTLHNRLDDMRQEPTKVNGLHGFVDMVEHKLAEKTKVLASMDKEVNAAIDRMNDRMYFDQTDIHTLAQEITEPSFVIPKHVSTKIKQAKSGISEAEHEPLLSPKDELNHIRSKLITDKGLRKNHTKTKEYTRLRELSDVWVQAKALLDRINLEHEYERQEAIRDVAKAFIDVLNSNIDKFADSGRVESYLRSRIDSFKSSEGEKSYSGKVIPTSDLERSTREQRKLPADHDTLIEDFQAQVDSANADEMGKDFKMVRERFEQFKDNETALAEMVDCFGGV